MLRFNNFDLSRVYIELFWRQGLWPLKAPFGQYVDTEYFISRGRYLLTTDMDEHIADLFDMALFSPIDTPGLFYWTLAGGRVAPWLAGLQKNRRFLDRILDDLVPRAGQHKHVQQYVCSGHYAALVLFDDPELAKPLLEICRAAPSKQALERARTTLAIMDRRFGTDHAASLPEPVRTMEDDSVARCIPRLLSYSEILRAGIEFDTPDALRRQLGAFIAEATPIEHWIAGACEPPRIREFRPWPDGWGALRREMAQWREECASWTRLNLTIPQARVRQFKMQWKTLEPSENPDYGGVAERSSPDRRRDFLCRAVRAWQEAEGPETLFWLQATSRVADDAFDIVSALEQDLYHRLPADVVDRLYDRLATQVGFDAEMCRQNACDLLLRSNAYDDKARALLARAEAIEARQQKLERYPLVKMPRGWVSAYPRNRIW